MTKNKSIEVLCKNIEYVLRRGFNDKNKLSILSYLHLGKTYLECQDAINYITEDSDFGRQLLKIFIDENDNFEKGLKQFIDNHISS